MNFLAFTNRINDKHFDVIWSSAQVNNFILFFIFLKKNFNFFFQNS
jgi:hypothetical protein